MENPIEAGGRMKKLQGQKRRGRSKRLKEKLKPRQSEDKVI